MSYAYHPHEGDWRLNRVTFGTLFVFGPLFMCSVIPSIAFGLLLGEWGSNVLWGSVFGLGWCVGDFAYGVSISDNTAPIVGMAWAWLVPFGLFFFSNWLWNATSERGRKNAITVLLATFALNLPASVFMAADRYLHLPDFTAHLVISY